MNKFHIRAWFMEWICRAIELQLFISLVSLPILVGWGLPISWMTIVSNLIFGPVLTLFLFLSTLIFFTELMRLPNGVLICVLEHITTAWHWMLSRQDQGWLFGCITPHPFFLVITVVGAFAIICQTTWKWSMRITAFMVVFGLFFSLSWWYGPTDAIISQLSVHGGSVTVIHYRGCTTVIDPGYIARQPSAQSWLQYTFAPWLLQTTGSPVIDNFILLQPSGRIFEAVAALSGRMKIHTMYIPYWQGNLGGKAHRHFCVLKEALLSHKASIVRIGNKSITIPLSHHGNLRIITLQENCGEGVYSDLCVECLIDKETTTIYAAKHISG